MNSRDTAGPYELLDRLVDAIDTARRNEDRVTLANEDAEALAELLADAPRPPASRLYRVDVTLIAGQGNHVYSPLPSYLVRASSPDMAKQLAAESAGERWQDAREVKTLRCWAYPASGVLVLAGADHLEVGEPCAQPETGHGQEAER
jgi:hypothetical protein